MKIVVPKSPRYVEGEVDQGQAAQQGRFNGRRYAPPLIARAFCGFHSLQSSVS